MKSKKVIIITSIIISIIIIMSIAASYIIASKNKKMKEQRVRVVIYQYHVKGENKQNPPTIIYSEEFTKDLSYDEYIYALDGNFVSDYNHVIIKNSEITVVDADCKEHVCERTKISLNNGSITFIDPATITIECKPHGLKITLEEIE